MLLLRGAFLFGYNFRYSAGTKQVQPHCLETEDGYSHKNPIRQVESNYPQGRLALDGKDVPNSKRRRRLSRTTGWR